MPIAVDKEVNFISNTEGEKDGLTYVVSVSTKKTNKQFFDPKGYVVIMKLIRIKKDSKQELLELIDNQGKDLHYHDKEPQDHDSRVYINDQYNTITDVISFFQKRVYQHIKK